MKSREAPFILRTDFSHIAFSAVLTQMQQGVEVLLATLGRKTNSAESGYGSFKGEFGAFIYGNRKLYHLLSYAPYVWKTDSKDCENYLNAKGEVGHGAGQQEMLW